MGRKTTRYTELNVRIGGRLKSERLNRKMTMQELASLLDYEHGNSVLYWERGVEVPLKVMSKLSDIFDVRIEYLMCKDDYREKWHRIMTNEEKNAWDGFIHTKLVDASNERDHYRYELKKAVNTIEITNIFDKGDTFYIDGVKLSSNELQSIKTIIEGIRANRKEK